MGTTVLPLFSDVIDWTLFILAGNDDIHKSLDEFEIQPDPTRNTKLPALELKKSMLSLFLGCFSSDPFQPYRL